MKFFLTISVLLISLSSLAQKNEDSAGKAWFDQGMNFYKNGNLDSAIAIWTTMVDNKIGKGYDTYCNAFFNIPALYWQLKNYDKAKEWYYRILASDLKDSDETGSLMEPHTNYKHKSAMAIAALNERDSNYNAVLDWLIKADTVYRYWGFEGSATNVSKEQAYILDWKVSMLMLLDKEKEAVRAIVIELICSDKLESFFSKSEEQLLTMLDKKTFIPEFDKSLGGLSIIEIDKSHWLAEFNFHGLSFQFPVSNIFPDRNRPHYWTIYFINKDTTPDKQKLIEYIKNRSFYKKARNL